MMPFAEDGVNCVKGESAAREKRTGRTKRSWAGRLAGSTFVPWRLGYFRTVVLLTVIGKLNLAEVPQRAEASARRPPCRFNGGSEVRPWADSQMDI